MRFAKKTMNFAERIEIESKREIHDKQHALNSISAKEKENQLKDEMINLAMEYFNTGKSLEELDENIRNHYFFKVGYERAKRLAYIAQLDQQERGRSK